MLQTVLMLFAHAPTIFVCVCVCDTTLKWQQAAVCLGESHKHLTLELYAPQHRAVQTRADDADAVDDGDFVTANCSRVSRVASMKNKCRTECASMLCVVWLAVNKSSFCGAAVYR